MWVGGGLCEQGVCACVCGGVVLCEQNGVEICVSKPRCVGEGMLSGMKKMVGRRGRGGGRGPRGGRRPNCAHMYLTMPTCT